MRVLGVDPGSKNIGLAISDPGGMIANPLMVIQHESRQKDAQTIARIAVENQAEMIVIGQALDDRGEPTFEGRQARRLAGALKELVGCQIMLWDESGSTKIAQEARQEMATRRKKRRGHLDELAATVILQSFLDANFPASGEFEA
jgi:putative Holliday junction resolvase